MKQGECEEKARTESNCRFTSLFHLINEEMLRECLRELRKDAAAGIDKVTKEEYNKILNENLKVLVGKLHRKKPVYSASPHLSGGFFYADQAREMSYRWGNRQDEPDRSL
ncbi:conserved hypothetical protein [delta proteobacterium NaphS2]|nr:conserved hypothetical protein [delta proteobacterium NaphS2]